MARARSNACRSSAVYLSKLCHSLRCKSCGCHVRCLGGWGLRCGAGGGGVPGERGGLFGRGSSIGRLEGGGSSSMCRSAVCRGARRGSLQNACTKWLDRLMSTMLREGTSCQHRREGTSCQHRLGPFGTAAMSGKCLLYKQQRCLQFQQRHSMACYAKGVAMHRVQALHNTNRLIYLDRCLCTVGRHR